MSATVRNVLAVARREFFVRIGSRSFLVATLLLAVSGAALALAPIGIRLVEGATVDRIGVVNLAFDPALTYDPGTRISAILNASAAAGQADFVIVPESDEATARAAVEGGKLKAAVIISRTPGPDLAFVVISKEPAGQRTPERLRQALFSLAIADRLDRLGVASGAQTTLFASPDVAIERPTPGKPGEPTTGAEMAAAAIVGQVLVIFLLLAIVLYGQWVATSAAEEKSSRVVEIVISAATPFQLLGGKVLGVGGLGLVQLLSAVIPALVAFMLQGPISQAVLGGPPSAFELPQALTPGIAAAFVLFFVLGYLLYSTLYAAAGSMVSRMEDVNNVVAPMSLLGSLAYLVGVYASIGLIPADSAPVIALSYIPFTSPYVMLSRVVAGQAGATDVAIAAAILVVTIGAALWAAARVYSAGVLMYGQAPSVRRLLVTAFGRQQ
jgi:ABC-2 type transport system permease protein